MAERWLILRHCQLTRRSWIDGGIADAKAVGEALAGKADAARLQYAERSGRSELMTGLAEKADLVHDGTQRSEVDAPIGEVEVETDTRPFPVSGAPADAKDRRCSALEDAVT